MQCLRDWWNGLRIWGPKQTCWLSWVSMDCTIAGRCQWLHWRSIDWLLIKSLTRCWITKYIGEAFNSDELSKYTAISTDNPMRCQIYRLLNNCDARYLGKVISCHFVCLISWSWELPLQRITLWNQLWMNMITRGNSWHYQQNTEDVFEDKVLRNHGVITSFERQTWSDIAGMKSSHHPQGWEEPSSSSNSRLDITSEEHL